jgi:hypothetical protein
MSQIKLELISFIDEQQASSFAHILNNTASKKWNIRYIVYADTLSWKVRQEKFICKYQYWV